MTIDEHIKTFKDHFYRARVYFPEYCSGLLWIIRDLFLAFSLAMIKLTVYSMVGASLQGAALVGAIKYVRSLEEGAPITLKGISIAIHGGQNLLPAVLMLFLLLALSAWILYRAKVVLIKLIADYHIYNLKRALSLFGTVVPGQSSPRDPSEALQFITSTITQDVQKIVMLVRFFGQSLPSLVILFYAFPILVYIDLSMTLLLMAVGILFLPFFYQANIMAYESDRLGKRAGPESKKILKSLMEEIKDFQHISPKQIKSINKAFRRGELKNKINTLPLFLQSLARTEFLTNMLLSLAVSLVIVTQVPGALASETRWSKLIAYILFLRLGVGSFKALMGFLTKFSRFYPYVVRYQNFVQSSHAAKSPDERIFIKAAPHGVSELDTPIQIYRPEFLALITGVPLSRYSFPYMVKLGTRSDNGIFVSLEDCFFIGPRGLPQKDGCLREMLGLADHFSAEDLKQAIPVDLLQELKTHF